MVGTDPFSGTLFLGLEQGGGSHSPCYRLDKWLNCLLVGATPPGSAVHMTRVSYISLASARGPASGRRSNRSILPGYPNLVSGWQLY